MGNSSNNNNTGGGIGFLGLLGILFIALKLCGVIAWSWLWVTAPLWGPVALVVGIALVAGIVFVICLAIGGIGTAIANSKRKKAEKEREAYRAILRKGSVPAAILS